MKNIKSAIILAFSILLISSCTKEPVTEGLSRTTFFADLTMAGDALIFHPLGDAFNDPGVTAKENGAEINVDVTGSVDINVPGFYTISYSATNSDGFSSSISRTIIVYESGDYVGIYDGTRVGRNGGLVLISTNAGGGYDVSDLLAGYYEYGRGYGNAYAAPSTLMIDGTTVTSVGGVCGFGPVEISDGTISEDLKIFNWTSTLTDFDFGFDIELTKITN